MPSRKPSAVFATFLVLSPLLLMLPPAVPAERAPAQDAARAARQPSSPPFGIGNWVVTDSEELRDSSFLLDGDLTIENGGSLTLVNTTFQLMPGPHEVRVKPGGELRVLAGSIMGSFDNTERDRARAGFWVESGARAEFRNSSFLSIGIIFRWIGWSMMGGICIYSDQTVIDNCTFSGNYIGLTYMYARAAMSSCLFDQNTWGAVSYGSDTQFTDCTFVRNFNGAVAYYGNVGFTGCNFSDNANGAVADSTNCRFLDCVFLDNVRQGLYVSPEQGLDPPPAPADVYVDDCLFARNRWGINGVFFYSDEGGNIIPLPHNIYITNSDFIKNAQTGVLWDRFIPDGKLRFSESTWKIDQLSTIENNTVHFKGNITVGGELRVNASVFMMESERPGWQDIEVRGGGRMLFWNSTLRAAYPKNPFGLFCRPGSGFEFNDSLLRDCGWDPALPESSGPLIESAGARFRRSTIEFCPVALYCQNVRGALVEGCSLTGYENALRMDDSSARLENCTLRSLGSWENSLDRASLLDSVNTTIDRERIFLGDNLSVVNISWHLDVSASWADGRPAGGASIRVEDLRGSEVANVTADGQGRAGALVLREWTISIDNATAYTPHLVRCRKGPIANESIQTADRYLSLEIFLIDSDPPSISIVSPVPGSFLSSGTVNIAGTAQDNLAVASVRLTVDGFRRYLVFDRPSGELDRVDWEVPVELTEGHHTLRAEVEDTGGNPASLDFSLTVDTVRPNILVQIPSDGSLTRTAEISVSGIMEPGAMVLLNGVRARTVGGTFAGTALLAEGDNVIAARAVDAAGNSDTATVRVRLDTRPPSLSIALYPDAAEVNRPELRVYGTMEFGAAVSVNGRRVVLPGLADNFTTPVFLSPGTNIISVQAEDAAGNINVAERRVVLDTEPPAFRVIYPPEGLQTRDDALTVALAAEAGSALSAGGENYTVPGEPGTQVDFTVPYALAEGENAILLRARDAAGNTYSITRHVTRDTLPPPLEVLAPADGSRTANASIYIMGMTEDNARLTVNGAVLEVGYGGSFSTEVKLSAGRNRLVVRAEDALGNAREVSVNLTRLPAKGEDTNVPAPGPDWPFVGFLAVAAGAAAGEGWWVSRRMGGGRKAPGEKLQSPAVKGVR